MQLQDGGTYEVRVPTTLEPGTQPVDAEHRPTSPHISPHLEPPDAEHSPVLRLALETTRLQLSSGLLSLCRSSPSSSHSGHTARDLSSRPLSTTQARSFSSGRGHVAAPSRGLSAASRAAPPPAPPRRRWWTGERRRLPRRRAGTPRCELRPGCSSKHSRRIWLSSVALCAVAPCALKRGAGWRCKRPLSSPSLARMGTLGGALSKALASKPAFGRPVGVRVGTLDLVADHVIALDDEPADDLARVRDLSAWLVALDASSRCGAQSHISPYLPTSRGPRCGARAPDRRSGRQTLGCASSSRARGFAHSHAAHPRERAEHTPPRQASHPGPWCDRGAFTEQVAGDPPVATSERGAVGGRRLRRCGAAHCGRGARRRRRHWGGRGGGRRRGVLRAAAAAAGGGARGAAAREGE